MVRQYEYDGCHVQNGAGLERVEKQMSNDVLLQRREFQAEDRVRLETITTGEFRMTSPPEGGGIRLRPGSVSSSAWTECQFVVADVSHNSHDVMVLLFRFEDNEGRSITYHVGILPGVPTTVCLPLKHLDGEKLFLSRYPGTLQTVLRGDARVDRAGITGFSIGTIPSTSDRSVEVASLRLSQQEPEFKREPQAYVDRLGQITGRKWPWKTEDEQELAGYLRAERAEAAITKSGDVASVNPAGQGGPFEANEAPAIGSSDSGSGFGFGFGRYGGWKGATFEPSGYFRIVFDGTNWWFVDPDGFVLFSAGMDCISPASPMRIAGMEHLLPELPGPQDGYEDAWMRGGTEFSFEIANLLRAFGSAWRDDWMALTEHRLRRWGFNTIGNWSDADFIRDSLLPYVYPLSDFPLTENRIFRDFPDVFSPEYERGSKMFAAQLEPLLEDRRLIGYFMRNEPQWAFVDGLNLTRLMLESPVRFVSKERFVEWMKDKYETNERLNAAWGSEYDSFERLFEPIRPGVILRKAFMEDCAAFNRKLIRRYVELPARLCKEVDPNHLNLGMRYAWVSSDVVLEGCEWFDVFSLNCYQFAPDREQIASISRRLNRPIMIGEYHFGAAEGGLPAYGIKAVATQRERGDAYRYYVEQAAAIPELIGVHYFQWNDQPALGRFDGENYQIGFVDVCNRPYQDLTEGAKTAHERMYAVRTGAVTQFSRRLKEIPKTGF
ncbi:Glycoside hydrolase family 42 N-terminal domain-containing protein [Paenibacillus lactis]